MELVEEHSFYSRYYNYYDLSQATNQWIYYKRATKKKTIGYFIPPASRTAHKCQLTLPLTHTSHSNDRSFASHWKKKQLKRSTTTFQFDNKFIYGNKNEYQLLALKIQITAI